MAKGFDELIEFLLSEIALCGVQGTCYSIAPSPRLFGDVRDHSGST